MGTCRTQLSYKDGEFSLGCTPEIQVLILSQFRAEVLTVHHK